MFALNVWLLYQFVSIVKRMRNDVYPKLEFQIWFPNDMVIVYFSYPIMKNHDIWDSNLGS